MAFADHYPRRLRLEAGICLAYSPNVSLSPRGTSGGRSGRGEAETHRAMEPPLPGPLLRQRRRGSTDNNAPLNRHGGRSCRNKKPSDSAKTENEGILKFLPKTVQELASSFSWTEKLVPHPRDRDEHRQTGILTSGFQPHSRLPGLASAKPVAVGVCSP